MGTVYCIVTNSTEFLRACTTLAMKSAHNITEATGPRMLRELMRVGKGEVGGLVRSVNTIAKKKFKNIFSL